MTTEQIESLKPHDRVLLRHRDHRDPYVAKVIEKLPEGYYRLEVIVHALHLRPEFPVRTGPSAATQLPSLHLAG